MKSIINFLKKNSSNIYKVTLLLITIGVIVWLYPNKAQFKYTYEIGKPWLYEDLIAEYDFPIYKKTTDLEEERKQLIEKLKLFYYYDEEATKKILENFEEDFINFWEKDQFYDRYDLQSSFNFAYKVLDTTLNKGIIEIPSDKTITVNKEKQIVLKRNNSKSTHLMSDFYTPTTAAKAIATAVYNKEIDEKIHKDFIYKIADNNLTTNIIYDKERNKSYRDKILGSISITKGMVQKEERVISRGEIVSEDTYQKLASLEKDFNNKVGSSVQLLWIKMGQLIIVGSILVILFIFIFLFRRKLFDENKKMTFIFIIILIMIWSIKLIVEMNIDLLYLFPIALLPLILRVFYDTRISTIIYLFSLILMGFLVPNSFNFITINSAVGIVAIMSIYNLHKRSRFFATALLIFLTYSFMFIGLFLIKEGDIQTIESKYFLFFAINALLTLFAYPLIYIFEKIFDMVTDITLLELSDTNTPLLRELMVKAPGTFQHSLQVANLAEDAIREIDGNSLLVKTAALYHDIGKMNMPLFFIENQRSGINPHNELTHQESANIIINHVIDGIEIAKKHRLPESIIDFIRTHHGTNKVEYFYRMQLMQYPEDDIDESLFTYRGPKPFSKETAVLMMADSCEAASRSLTDPNEENISILVEKIINRQMENGQFDNADITFKDINTVKRLLIRKLMNIYHVRISYPEN